MTQEKTIEVLRKKNAKLQGELDALKGKNAKSTDESKGRRVDELLFELEGIKKQWQDALDDLKAEKVKYTELIKDMRNIKRNFGAV